MNRVTWNCSTWLTKTFSSCPYLSACLHLADIIWALQAKVNIARHLPFFKQAQHSKVQKVSLLGFPVWRAASLVGEGSWEWLPLEETTLRKCAPVYVDCIVIPIYIKDTHIRYHEGHSVVRDADFTGKNKFLPALGQNLLQKSLYKGHWEIKGRIWVYHSLWLEWIHFPFLLCWVSYWATYSAE